jgi:hypothetical protein
MYCLCNIISLVVAGRMHGRLALHRVLGETERIEKYQVLFLSIHYALSLKKRGKGKGKAILVTGREGP